MAVAVLCRALLLVSSGDSVLDGAAARGQSCLMMERGEQIRAAIPPHELMFGARLHARTHTETDGSRLIGSQAASLCLFTSGVTYLALPCALAIHGRAQLR